MAMRARTVSAVALALLAAACGGGITTTTSGATPSSSSITAPGSSSPPASPSRATVPEVLDFEAPLLGGGSLQGADLAGKDVAFWFWAPW
jgi:hypothetical protein